MVVNDFDWFLYQLHNKAKLSVLKKELRRLKSHPGGIKTIKYWQRRYKADHDWVERVLCKCADEVIANKATSS